MNRGSRAGACRHLPWSAGFNEAPIHESGKSGAIAILGRIHQASMRPRFMNRGSHGQAGLAVGQRRASMRPRFMNRGSMAASAI